MNEIFLFSRNMEAARAEISECGGRILQEFSAETFLALLPEEVDPQSLNYAQPELPDTASPASELAYASYQRLQEKQRRSEGLAPDAREGLPWDAEGFQPPEESAGAPARPEGAEGVAESTGTPTSLYMTGRIAVGVVIISGPGELAISREEQELIVSEVQEGLGFLAREEPRARISFHYDIQVVNVSAQPGSTADYESAEAPWRNEALGAIGYPASRQGSLRYVQDIMEQQRTDWAYVAYFTKYPLHHFAYAVEEKVVMHLDNDGWGRDAINRVFAHETCHIFGAADEYGSCSCTSRHGYLSVPNRNCVNCVGEQESCLMGRNELQMCSWTRRQIGWDEELFPNPAAAMNRAENT